MEFDFERFVYIGNKIDEKIYDIPNDDLKYFIESKEKIQKALDLYDFIYDPSMADNDKE